jgi:hypothetical protein
MGHSGTIRFTNVLFYNLNLKTNNWKTLFLFLPLYDKINEIVGFKERNEKYEKVFIENN